MLTILVPPDDSVALAAHHTVQLAVALNAGAVRARAGERGVTLSELARQLNVVPSTMTNWLTGSRAIPVGKAVDLAVILDADLDVICRARLQLRRARRTARHTSGRSAR